MGRKRRRRERKAAREPAPPPPTAPAPRAPRRLPALAGLLLVVLGLVWLVARARATEGAAALLRASLEADEEAFVDGAARLEQAREQVRAWSDRLDFDLTSSLCEHVDGRVECALFGCFASDQPQVFVLRCDGKACQIKSMGISAMPGP